MKKSIINTETNRRVFVLSVATGAALLTATRPAAAQAMVSESDPQAVALGFVADASKVDKSKHPKFVAGSRCGNCALYQGGANAKGGCPLFAGKQVSANSWCNSYVKKA